MGGLLSSALVMKKYSGLSMLTGAVHSDQGLSMSELVARAACSALRLRPYIGLLTTTRTWYR